jgi:hypothetical protein
MNTMDFIMKLLEALSQRTEQEKEKFNKSKPNINKCLLMYQAYGMSADDIVEHYITLYDINGHRPVDD